MVPQFKVFFRKAQRKKPVFAVVLPVVEPFEVGAGLAEKFKLHLLEFAHAENEVSRRDFVAERFAYLAYAEGHAHTRGALYVFEVYEYALRRFGAEVYGVHAVLGNALEGLEHKVELSYGSKVALSAHGADHAVLFYKGLHSVVVHRLNLHVQLVLFAVVLNKVIRPVARLAIFAVHKRVRKAAYVARSLPRARVHKYRAVKARVVYVLLNEFFPPRLFDVVFKLHAKGAVVPRVGKSAVNFASGEDEAPVFAQCNKFFLSDGSLFISHKKVLQSGAAKLFAPRAAMF